jgi:NADH-quinone oxidoreductase subunit L
MIVRMSPLFELAAVAGTDVLQVVAWVGGLTALMGATIALTKTDLKRILAYSTVSQLGFMFLAVGAGSYVAAMFHLTTHAFFKACLFLGAGSVMHSLHGELDINKMGGLKNKMRSTYLTFLIAAAALAGFPLMAGYFSKDAVLVGTFESHQYVLYAVGLLTALLTAIYAFKMVFMVFWGQPRDRNLYNHAHEQPRLMTWPLWVLAFLSIFGGALNLPFIASLEQWIEPIYELGPEGATEHPELVVEVVLLAVSALVALAGIYLAYYFYVKNPGVTDRIRERMAVLHRVASAGYYFDAAYDALRRGFWVTAHFFADTVDQGGIDAAVNGVARGAGWLGERTRRLQTGLVGTYALTMFVGLVIVLGYFLISSLVK